MYVPSLLSIKGLREPEVTFNSKLLPPPAQDFLRINCCCYCLVEKPSLNIIDGFAEMIEVVSDAAPVVIVNALLVPCSVPEVFVAVSVQEPMFDMLTVNEGSTPSVNGGEVPIPVPMVQLDVSDTVPLNEVAVFCVPSTAIKEILKSWPANLSDIFPEGAL